MGNCAVITTADEFQYGGIGIYLHWNGGYNCVTAFLEYCKLRGFRTLTEDREYGYARLCQVIANFFGGSLSVGIGPLQYMDMNNGDNGVYIVEGWDVVDRKYFSGKELTDPDIDSMIKLLRTIDKRQPRIDRIFKKASDWAKLKENEKLHQPDLLIFVPMDDHAPARWIHEYR